MNELSQDVIDKLWADIYGSASKAREVLQDLVDVCKWLLDAPNLESSDKQGLSDAATLLEQELKKPVFNTEAIKKNIKLILLVMESIGWDKPPQLENSPK